MASITTETRGGKTLYRLEYLDKDKRRRKIRLGSINKRDAQAIVPKIESIVSSHVSGNDLNPAIVEWLGNLGDDLHSKLASQGLCQPRVITRLEDWISNYIRDTKHQGGEYRTRNLEQTQLKLQEFFSPDSQLRGISAKGAINFREWLVKQGYAQATVAQHIKRARQFFNAAVKQGLLTENPFAEVIAGSQVNSERSYYVSVEEIEKVIAMAPNAQWQLLIALSRYGGMRCPSEILTLRWSDVDFKKGRITVPSNKTAKQGKPFRLIPLFEELRPYLEDAFDSQQEFVITIYRDR